MMEEFNIVVGISAIFSATMALCSFVYSIRAAKRSKEVEAKLIEIQTNFQALSALGGSIQAGGEIKAGKGIHAYGGVINNGK